MVPVTAGAPELAGPELTALDGPELAVLGILLLAGVDTAGLLLAGALLAGVLDTGV